MSSLRFLLLLVLLGSLAPFSPAQERVSSPARLPVAIVPLPERIVPGSDADLRWTATPTIGVEDPRLEPTAAVLAEFWWRLSGDRPRISSALDADIVLGMEASEEGDERHRLEISDRVLVTGSSRTAVAHGCATLLQLVRRDEAGWVVPSISIGDAPEHAFRSVMVDVARQPHGIPVLEHVIDLMFLCKVRYLQLHLTDDQSFRFPFPPVTDRLPGNVTIPIADWKALVAYGEARGVTIIPELDLPGHSTQLKRSGYLEDPTPENPLSDRDVAHPVNHQRIFAIIDAMQEVFVHSPWFHIGGDESGAGPALVPFLAAVNRHVRGKPASQRRRLMVWEGFHGTPEELPARGEDHVVVVSWESAYNPPWALLDAGYRVVNASWKPLYVVGGGTPRYPHIGGRYWSPEDIHAWDKDAFWHWQPGTPVFEDRGPGDDHPDDGVWRAPAGQRHQIIGGQLLFWEQRQETVLTEAWDRVAALSDRLWAGGRPGATDRVGFRRRLDQVRERTRELVQPVRMTLDGSFDPSHPTGRDHVWFHGAITVTCQMPSGLSGEVRLTRDGTMPLVTSELYQEPLRIESAARLVAQLFVNGRPVGAPARVNLDRRPAKVRVAWFDLPRRALSHVPDFADRTRWKPSRVDLLPELRGPYRTERPRGQMLEGTLQIGPAEAGEYRFRLQTRDGRARLYLNGEPLLGPSDPGEKKLFASRRLEPGAHRIRVDHASGNISPVVIVAVRGPGDDRFVDIGTRLREIPRGTEPEVLKPHRGRTDLLEDGLRAWRFTSPSGASMKDVVAFDEKERVLTIAGRPGGYLETRRWFRDYRLKLEWRWPEGGKPGNSGVLVHVSEPLLFYGWPRSLEVQLAHGMAGDFWTIGEGVDLLVERPEERRVAPRPGDLHSHRRIRRLLSDPERAVGEWNRMEITCRGGEIVVRVNGLEVNRGLDCSETRGGIALQSEGAPIEFRNVSVEGLEHVVR